MRLILAPLAEITDAPFRKICKEHGADLTYTQMVSAKGVVKNTFISLKHISYHFTEKPIGIQFIGNKPEYFEAAINEIKSLKPDFINLNCGCSVTNVTDMNMGAALLGNPNLLGSIIRTMVKAAGEIPISVKIRLGKNRNKINAVDNAKLIEDSGAKEIIVHARTQHDAYDDPVDWEWISKVKDSVSIDVIGNGSLLTVDDYKKMIEITNCDGIMIARGSLGNPFLFRRIKSIINDEIDPGFQTIDEVKEIALRHLNYQVLDNGEPIAVGKIKKHLIWYFRFFKGINYFIDEIFQIDNKESLIDLIMSHTSKIKNEEYPSVDFEEINKKFYSRVLFWMDN